MIGYGLESWTKEKKINEVIEILGGKPDDLKDKNIFKFVMNCYFWKNSPDWWLYKNGNGICTLNKKTGTMLTTVLSDEPFKAEFPLNCDMNISNKCINGCAFCYQGCTPNGKHADIKKFIEDKNSFLYSLHEGTELAINGNEPLHPDLELLLNFCKEHDIVANLTVRENTLLENVNTINKWLKNDLLHGVGISPSAYSDEMIEWCQKHKTAVIHTIAGITLQQQYEKLMNKKLKILILGYKTFGNGIAYADEFECRIKKNIEWLKENVSTFVDFNAKYNKFAVVSFDNLAIEQLNPKTWIGNEAWDTFYRGDDGSHTLFIDLVDETFAMNSVQPKENHKPLLSDIRDMLKDVQSQMR